ncbi:hypothetical protein S40293_11441 [Stachybotrys chartarum IBT 40293]|nr:hypothetical protein S40293_11441 [Stachybotrys chartarum IBT 40293]
MAPSCGMASQPPRARREIKPTPTDCSDLHRHHERAKYAEQASTTAKEAMDIGKASLNMQEAWIQRRQNAKLKKRPKTLSKGTYYTTIKAIITSITGMEHQMEQGRDAQFTKKLQEDLFPQLLERISERQLQWKTSQVVASRMRFLRDFWRAFRAAERMSGTQYDRETDASQYIARPDDDAFFRGTTDDGALDSIELIGAEEEESVLPESSQFSQPSQSSTAQSEEDPFAETPIRSQRRTPSSRRGRQREKSPTETLHRNGIAKARRRGPNEHSIEMKGMEHLPAILEELKDSMRICTALRQSKRPAGADDYDKAMENLRFLRQDLGLELSLLIMEWLDESPMNLIKWNSLSKDPDLQEAWLAVEFKEAVEIHSGRSGRRGEVRPKS